MEILRALLSVVIAVTQLAVGAVVIGFLPALWIIARSKRKGMLLRWIGFWLISMGALYGTVVGMEAWREWLGPRRDKPHGRYVGYFVGVMFACYTFAEPLRLAHNRLRPGNQPDNEQNEGRDRKRKRRKKRRRTNNYDV